MFFEARICIMLRTSTCGRSMTSRVRLSEPQEPISQAHTSVMHRPIIELTILEPSNAFDRALHGVVKALRAEKSFRFSIVQGRNSACYNSNWLCESRPSSKFSPRALAFINEDMARFNDSDAVQTMKRTVCSLSMHQFKGKCC